MGDGGCGWVGGWVWGGGSWRGSQQLLTSCLSLNANFGVKRGLEGERKRFRALGSGGGVGCRPVCLWNLACCWGRKQEVAHDREPPRMDMFHHCLHGKEET